MTTQPELGLFGPPKPPQDIDPDAARVFAELAGCGWVGREALQLRLGGAFEWPEKRIRDAANASKGYIISGPGSPGYIRVDECDLEQGDHVRRAMRQQGRRMLRRSIEMNNKLHAYAKRHPVREII